MRVQGLRVKARGFRAVESLYGFRGLGFRDLYGLTHVLGSCQQCKERVQHFKAHARFSETLIALMMALLRNMNICMYACMCIYIYVYIILFNILSRGPASSSLLFMLAPPWRRVRQ